LQNRENAMALLEYRLEEKRRAEEEAAVGGARKEQIGGAKRAEKIRTYNVPQDRVTDHRVKKAGIILRISLPVIWRILLNPCKKNTLKATMRQTNFIKKPNPALADGVRLL